MPGWPYNTARWKRVRQRQLSAHPLCEACKERGIITPANHVDHRVPISAGGDAFPEQGGLASLCAACHSAKTARGIEHGAVRTSKPRRGCTADGTPLDPSHPWNQGRGVGSEKPAAEAGIPPRNKNTQLVSKDN